MAASMATEQRGGQAGRLGASALFLVLAAAGPLILFPFFQHEQLSWRLLFAGVIPALPFFILAILALVRRRAGYLCSLPALAGAAVGAALSISTPWSLLWIASQQYTGGGANIGLGILLLLHPLVIPVAMVLFGTLGAYLGNPRKTSSAAPAS